MNLCINFVRCRRDSGAISAEVLRKTYRFTRQNASYWAKFASEFRVKPMLLLWHIPDFVMPLLIINTLRRCLRIAYMNPSGELLTFVRFSEGKE